MENKNWTPTQEHNLGIITRVYESIKEEPYELQEETAHPVSFIYDLSEESKMSGTQNHVIP